MDVPRKGSDALFNFIIIVIIVGVILLVTSEMWLPIVRADPETTTDDTQGDPGSQGDSGSSLLSACFEDADCDDLQRCSPSGICTECADVTAATGVTILSGSATEITGWIEGYKAGLRYIVTLVGDFQGEVIISRTITTTKYFTLSWDLLAEYVFVNAVIRVSASSLCGSSSISQDVEVPYCLNPFVQLNGAPTITAISSTQWEVELNLSTLPGGPLASADLDVVVLTGPGSRNYADENAQTGDIVVKSTFVTSPSGVLTITLTQGGQTQPGARIVVSLRIINTGCYVNSYSGTSGTLPALL